jgi:hypothetical protein
MSRLKIAERLFWSAMIAAASAVALSLTTSAIASSTAHKPRVATGGIAHIRGTTAVLQGSVNPEGAETTYYFRYGPTPAYGSQTTPASAGKGTTKVKVGQTVAHILPGYHYRLVATNALGTALGKDRTFSTKKGQLTIELVRNKEELQPATVYGGTFVLSGRVTGTGAALHQVALQASPYPFHEAFAAVGPPVVSNASGGFAFRIRNLTQSTQFRVATLDPRPAYSSVMTEHVAVRVTLKVRSSGRPGLVRLYGTVTPAKPGAPVYIQLRKAVRPGRSKRNSERTTKFASQFKGVVRRATSSLSRFSVVAKIQHTGHYRAFVKLGAGAQVSGASVSIVLHAPPSASKTTKK